MKSRLLIVPMFLFSFWSCNSDQVLLNNEAEMLTAARISGQEEFGLKSGELGIQNDSYNGCYTLMHKDRETGVMFVKNNSANLTVRFQNDLNHRIDLVQLWVGTDLAQVPVNPVGIPVPGKFPHKDIGFNHFLFQIPLDLIPDEEDIENGVTIKLLAHVETTNLQSGEKESAWSQGEIFNEKSNATFSEYTPGMGIGGSGCFPFSASGGSFMNDGVYYDVAGNTQQHIVARIGQNSWIKIGSVVNDSGNLIFNFDQDWMFTDLIGPELVVTGYNEPGIDGSIVHTGAPLSPQPPMYYYWGPATVFNYYKLEMNVQYCY